MEDPKNSILDSLNPALVHSPISEGVRANREEAIRDSVLILEATSEARAAHVECYESVIGKLIAAHEEVADTLDFSLEEATRWSALWLMGGRCLGLYRAYLHLIVSGFATESVSVARTLHEALRLLDVFTAGGFVLQEGVPNEILDPEQERVEECDRLLVKWLQDEGKNYVRPFEARNAAHRNEELVSAMAKYAGANPLAANAQSRAGEIYDLMSRSCHNRRNALGESYSPDLRKYYYGPHACAEIRIGHLDYSGYLIEDLVFSLENLLILLRGEEWMGKSKALRQEIAGVRERFPLSKPNS